MIQWLDMHILYGIYVKNVNLNGNISVTTQNILTVSEQNIIIDITKNMLCTYLFIAV